MLRFFALVSYQAEVEMEKRGWALLTGRDGLMPISWRRDITFLIYGILLAPPTNVLFQTFMFKALQICPQLPFGFS